jgi:hypothetical protein
MSSSPDTDGCGSADGTTVSREQTVRQQLEGFLSSGTIAGTGTEIGVGAGTGVGVGVGAGAASDRPVSYTERCRAKKALSEAIKQGWMSEDDSLVIDIRTRLEFSYIPPFSSPSFLTPAAGTQAASAAEGAGAGGGDSAFNSEISRGSGTSGSGGVAGGTAAGTDEGGTGSDSYMGGSIVPDMYRIVPADELVKCIIHRTRSSMRTVFRLYWGEEKDDGSPICKESNFLLGSRKVAAGLSFQYLVWPSSETKDWKEKTATAKISISNSVFFASVLRGAQIPETGSQGGADGGGMAKGCGRMIVSVRSPEKLVQICAALVQSDDAIDESVLVDVLEVLYHTI